MAILTSNKWNYPAQMHDGGSINNHDSTGRLSSTGAADYIIFVPCCMMNMAGGGSSLYHQLDASIYCIEILKLCECGLGRQSVYTLQELHSETS
eukprot:5115160-Pleurochrysis_carterae.AAC.1